ncbi:MAG: hypothetical protein AAFR35_11505 [Pseudomonadota bacterium]
MLRIALLVGCLLGQPAFAQTTVSASDLFASMHLDPAFRQDLRERGYTGARFDIMVEHTRELFTDPVVINGLTRHISGSLRQSGYEVTPQMMAQMDTILWQSYGVGVSRLTSAERYHIFSVDSGFIRSLPQRECNRLINGQASPERAQSLLDAYLVRISPDALSNYHRAERQAMRLGLVQGAAPVALSRSEIRRAEELLLPAIDTMIGQQPNADALYRAWAAPTGGDRYACTFSKMFSVATMRLGGRDRDVAIRYLMQ